MSKYSDFKEWLDAFEADISDVAVAQVVKQLGLASEGEIRAEVESGKIDIEDVLSAVTSILYADHVTTKMQAEIDALKAAQTWQPIESAPKDGTRVMVSSRTTVDAAQWSDRRDAWMISPDWSTDPTHWMPLPPAPETAK